MKQFSTLFFALVFLVFQSDAQYVVFGDNYATNVTFVPFGGSVNTLSIDATQARPGSSGTSSLKIPVTTSYTGGALVHATAQDLSTYNAISFWAKNDNAAFRLDGAGFANTADASTTVYACERNGLTLSATWTKFIIPIPVPSKLTAETGLFHFAEGSGEGMYNIWIDDIQYETIGGGVIGNYTASFATETQTKAVGETFLINGTTSNYMVNGVEQPMQTARAFFTWLSSNSAVASVNAQGMGTANGGGSATISGKLGAVDASGLLTVNVTAPLAVPTMAAPTPTRAGYAVKSLFSNVYTNNPVETWETSWSGGFRDYSEVQLQGNDTKKYVLKHFTGVEFINNPIDATVGLDSIHFDLWTPNANTPFTLRLVNFAPNNGEGEVTVTPVANGWRSYDFALSQFTTLPGKQKLSQMLFLVASGTQGTFYLDNIYFYNSGASLPVTLSDFNVTRRGNTSVLNWKTATEFNSKGFAVERSANGTVWSQLQFVNSANNSTSIKQYNIVDKAPAKGVNYYRLKQVDNDGKFSYSSVVSLKFSANGLSGFSFYPNPAKSKITVLLETILSRSASLQLLNGEGKVIRNVVLSDKNSDSNISIDIANLTKGVYYLSLKDGPSVQTTKVMIN